jgi:FG-GAP-like repeat
MHANAISSVKCRSTFLALISLFCALTISRAGPTIFTNTSTALPAIAHSSVMCGDFDNDGKMDLLVTGINSAYAGISQVWKNAGNGVFSNLNVTLPGTSSSSAALGDFDNDGRLDILLTGYAGQDTNNSPILISQVWRNLGNGAFSNANVALPGVDTGSVAWADYDNDGRLDILLTGYSSNGPISQVWHNQGNGAFTNINAGLPGVFYSSVAWGDFDNDGKPDILLTGTTNGFIAGSLTQVWRNLGNGTFTNLNAGLPGVLHGAVAWGDYDNDGRPDILLSGYSSNGPITQVWRNVGNGTFTNINAGLPGVYQSSVAWGDYDNDGHLDILLAGVDVNSNTISQVWRNVGNGTFTNISAGLQGMSQGCVTWIDFDNDGKLDILLTGFDAASNPALALYRNNTPQKNTNTVSITSLNHLTNGFSRVTFKGPMGFGYRVLGSTNLTSWNVIGSAAQAGHLAFQFTEGNATNYKARFYRISMP